MKGSVETRYARSGDAHIAYQAVGDGDLDLVLLPGAFSHVEHQWEEPSFARFLHRLASFSRLIVLDVRGTGLSDRAADLPTLEEQIDDVLAVLDTVGSERAVLFGSHLTVSSLGFDDDRHRSRILAEAMTVVIKMPYPAAMAAKNETQDPAADRRRSPARARMVRSAATLIRERGVHGTGLRQVVAHSGGPRGSLGRFFPGGKTQLVTEAIDLALVEMFGDLERALSEAETFPEAISVIVTPWRRLLVDHDFTLGCPLAATTCDAADNDSLRTHVVEWLGRWRAPVVDAYTRFGAQRADAEAHATVLMAALEGALMLARAQRKIEPVNTVERFFAARAPDPGRASDHSSPRRART